LNPYFRSAKSATIAALLQHERLSRSELAEITGVSPASITEVSQNLLQQGLLVELPLPQTGKRRGRPSVQLRLQASHSYFVGISISEIATPMVITDLQGHILARQTIPFCKTLAELTVAIRNNYAIILRDAAIPRSRVRGVGITVAGIVDSELGVCRYLAALNWRDVPVSEMIGKALKLLHGWTTTQMPSRSAKSSSAVPATILISQASFLAVRSGPPTTCTACSIVGTMAARAKSATLRLIQMEHYAAADEMAASRPLLAGPRYVPQPKHVATP
jgi:hypothetical protein